YWDLGCYCDIGSRRSVCFAAISLVSSECRRTHLQAHKSTIVVGRPRLRKTSPRRKNYPERNPPENWPTRGLFERRRGRCLQGCFLQMELERADTERFKQNIPTRRNI